MTITRTIDQITEWINQHVCPEIQLKVPPKDREPTDGGYHYQLSNPHAFPMFLPTRDKLPEGIESAFPSICVQAISTTDELTEHNRRISVSLGFGVWNPGTHKEDWITENAGDFRPSAEGWRDLWNLIDLTTAKIQSANYLGTDIEVMRNEPMTSGPYKEDGAIADYYPFWYGYLDFYVRTSLIRNNPDWQQYL